MSRESAAAKGKRYLVEGRLSVKHVSDRLIVANCRGDSGEVYALGFDPDRHEWRCTCPARTRCAHLVGLMPVAVREEPG